MWGVHNKGRIQVPSHGTAGELLIAWKGDFYDLLTMEYGTFFLSVKLQEKQQGNLWWITCVYGPSTNSSKSNLDRIE